ncbi:unnamed protein product, partial [Mesorhabditis spiculigera]
MLLVVQPAGGILSITIRLVKHGLLEVGIVTNPTVYRYMSLSSEAVGAIALNLIFAIGFERYLASRNLTDYEEKYENNRLASIFIAGTAVLVFFNLGMMYLQLVPLTLTFIIVYLTQGVAMLFFCWLYKTCRRQFYIVYEMKATTVAARYKTQTNYKASRLLLALAPFKFCFSILIVLEYHFLITRSEYTQIVYVFALFYTIQFQTFCQMWFIIVYELRFRSLICGLFVRGGSKKSRWDAHLKSVHGTKLQYEPGQQQDAYFAQLQSMWK